MTDLVSFEERKFEPEIELKVKNGFIRFIFRGGIADKFGCDYVTIMKRPQYDDRIYFVPGNKSLAIKLYTGEAPAGTKYLSMTKNIRQNLYNFAVTRQGVYSPRYDQEVRCWYISTSEVTGLLEYWD